MLRLLPVSRLPHFWNWANRFESVSSGVRLEKKVRLAFLLMFSVVWPLMAQTDQDWYMAGANPQRTSWVSEEVRGNLQPVWYRQFEPYISQKIQVVASGGTLFISTSSGLYALVAKTGSEKWVYPTSMPLGHSPTVVDGVVYVGCFDHQIHAIDSASGQRIWAFLASKGFQTNPLVVNQTVYVGNRDGYMYSLEAGSGTLNWRFRTDGPILFSAAYRDGLIFFASNDSHAYALDAETGALVWKSEKLPGAGFRSWWPVLYRDVVIFPGSHNYKYIQGSAKSMVSPHPLELEEIYPNRDRDEKGTFIGPAGNERGDWAPGTLTLDTSRPNVTASGTTRAITEYFEEKPWRRTYFVLDKETGEEITYDFDEDGRKEYAPILWAASHSGNRYPPAVGGDDVLYQQNNYMSDRWIPGGHVSGWKLGTPYISVPFPTASGGIGWGWNAVDEPLAVSAGGDLVYFNNCCDRIGGWVDVTQPSGHDWEIFYSYNLGYGTSLEEKIPGYNTSYYNPDSYTSQFASFGTDGPYGWHADGNPPVPHRGKLYMIRSNAVIAFAPSGREARRLPPSEIEQAELQKASPDTSMLRKELIEQVERILEAGHLRPAYISHGLFDSRSSRCGDNLGDYWHDPSDTLYTLTLAFPYLDGSLKVPLRNYLKTELNLYPPLTVSHTGWEGAPREVFDVPPDQDDMSQGESRRHFLWKRNPFVFYALWKYAEAFGGAKEFVERSRGHMELPPGDEDLMNVPNALNAYIAGHLGFLGLERLAKQPESTKIRSDLDHLIELRLASLSDNPDYLEHGSDSEDLAYCRALSISDRFMFLVPELAEILSIKLKPEVEKLVRRSQLLAPYWFVSNPEEGLGENALSLLYDKHAIFQAKALILKEPFEELARYLDVPAVARGDLYYMQALVTLLNVSDSERLRRKFNMRRNSRAGGG